MHIPCGQITKVASISNANIWPLNLNLGKNAHV